MAVELVSASTLDTKDLARVRAIYEDGFAAHLRSDFAGLVERSPRASESPLVLLDEDGPCGFAMLRQLGGTGWTFLRYFVVDGARRGQGLGSVLWQELTSHLTRAGYSLLTFDVEDPDEDDLSAEEHAIRKSRIRFYDRQGAHLLPVNGYRTPDSESPQWTQMLLMGAPLGGAALPGPRSVVLAVYRHRWELRGDDPVVREALDRSDLYEVLLG